MRDIQGTIKIIPKIIILSWAIIGGCAPQNNNPQRTPLQLTTPDLQVTTQDGRALLTVNAVALMPVMLDTRVRSLTPHLPLLEQELQEAAARQVDFRVVSTEEVLKAAKIQQPLTSQMLQQVGKKLQVDAVIVTTLRNYVEREGSVIGAEQPARVDFEMTLVRVGDGKAIWQATYHAEDQALSENLFQIPERIRSHSAPRWRSARELAVTGFNESMQKIVAARTEQFFRG